MSKSKKQNKLLSSVIFFSLYLVVISIVLWISYIIIQSTLRENDKNRAFDELHAKVSMQVTATKEIIDREYTRLHIIESVLVSQDKADWNGLDAAWELMHEKEKNTMLGFADMVGNVINCNGEKLGNIGGRDYFVDIVQGRAEEKCVFLESTIRSSESEFLYAIPIRVNGKKEGVLLKTKTISSLEDDLMEDVQFDGNASMFLVNADGDVLLVGDEEDRFLLSHNLFEGCDNFVFQEEQKEKIQNDLRDEKSGECIFKQNGKVQYAVYTPVGVEDWTIFSVVDKDVATLKYKKNDEIIEKSMILVMVLFLISLLVSVIFIVLHGKKQKELKRERFYLYHLYKKIMSELTFPVFRYHEKDDIMIGNKKFAETYGRKEVEHFKSNVEEWKKIYPEYDYNGLFSEIEKVLKYRKVMIFESVLQLENGKNGWFKTILIPVRDVTEEELIVFGIILDTTQEHKKFEETLEKLEIQLNEARIKISTGQMQPHFLYNALASIREVVLENPEYAADLIFDFTTHLRACIKSMAGEEMISFSQEIENIKAYVSIEKMRFGDKMQVEYDIQESDFQIVPLSIQPLVENAIRHGIYERGNEGGIVKISSYRQKDKINIMIEDNGVGFDVEKIAKEVKAHERDSTGLQNLIFRFENLMNATVNIESVIGTGTKVTIKIPVKGEKNNASDYSR